MGFVRGRPAPLARGDALPPGRDEPDRQFAPDAADSAPGRRRRSPRSRCACATRRSPTSHSLDLGAWEMPTRASAMELNIPGIHGVGDSLIYFVDRYADFSIYDVDFVLLPGTSTAPARRSPGCTGSAWCRRSSTTAPRDWLDFYESLFGFTVLPQGQYFGVLPKGTLLESPCHKFYLQLDRAAAGLGGNPLGRGPGARRPRRAGRPGGRAGAAGARHRVRRPRRGAAERQGRARPRSTWAASPSSWS